MNVAIQMTDKVWDFLKSAVGELGSFLRSKVFLVIVILVALYFGVLNVDTLRGFVESLKELF